MTEAATRLAAAEQIIRAVADALPPLSLSFARLLHTVADALTRDHERTTAADELTRDFWETIR